MCYTIQAVITLNHPGWTFITNARISRPTFELRCFMLFLRYFNFVLFTLLLQEEDKKMKAYAVIPPMLNQNQRKLKFINNNGLITEPMALYKQKKQATSWSAEEKELFKEKYLERPKQFGQIADLLEKKVDRYAQITTTKYLQIKPPTLQSQYHIQ